MIAEVEFLATVADRDAEAELAGALTVLLPGSVVIGEEAVTPGCSRNHAVRVAALRSGRTSTRRWVTASISTVV